MPNEPNDVTASPEIPQPTASPVEGQLTEPAAAPPAAAPTQYPAMGSSQGLFHNLSHAFTGAVLGTLAGPQPVSSYQVDEKGNVAPRTDGADSTASRLGRIARNAMMGLSAASNANIDNPGAARLAGIGAGFGGVTNDLQREDLIKRNQAKEDFEMRQQAKMTAMNNAHINLEMLKMRGEMAQSNIETQEGVAKMGNDLVDAAIAGGNGLMGTRDMNGDEVKQWMERPDHLNYTAVLSKVEPKLDPDGNLVGANRMYTLVDLKKPIELTDSMVTHLKTVGVPGAESLEAGQKVDPKQFQALYWTGLKQYNAMANDPKNVEIVDSRDAQGNPVKVLVNKALKSTQILRDETGQPLSGKVSTEQTKIYDPDTRKTWVWIVDGDTGKKIKRVGEAPTDFNTDAVGDYSIDTTTPEGQKAFISSLPPEMQGMVTMALDYRGTPNILGRGGRERTQAVYAIQKASNNTWDEKEFPTRLKFVQDWSGSTGRGATKDRINTAVGHLSDLLDASKLLEVGDLQSLNLIAQKVGVQIGQDPKVVYDTIADKVAGETAGAIKGGSAAATDVEIERTRKAFDSKISPSQQRGVIISNLKLIDTQANTLRNDFQQVMKSSPEQMGRPVFNPQSDTIMQKLGGVHGSPQSGPQNGQPQGSTKPSQATHVAPGVGPSAGKFYWVDDKGTVWAEASGMR